MVCEDYYQLLGVGQNVSREDLKHAFHARIQEVHPDHNPDDPMAALRTRKIIDAYRVLSNSSSRRQYDAFSSTGVRSYCPPPAPPRQTSQAFSSRIFAVLVFVLMGTVCAVISGAFTESQFASHGTPLRIRGIEARADYRSTPTSCPGYWCSKLNTKPEEAADSSPLVVEETGSTFSLK